MAGNARSAQDGTIHPFLWTRAEGIRDSGAIPGANLMVAPCCNLLNDLRQIAGFWIDQQETPMHFLWEHGTYTDLNTRIPKDSDLYLEKALSINSSGQIPGSA